MNEQQLRPVISICSNHLKKIIEKSEKFKIINLRHSMLAFKQCYTELQKNYPGIKPVVITELPEKKERLWKINQFITKISLRYQLPIIGIHELMTHPSVIYTSFRAGILKAVEIKNTQSETWLNKLENTIDEMYQIKVNHFDLPDSINNTSSRLLICGKHGKAILIIGGMGCIESLQKIIPELSHDFPPVIVCLSKNFSEPVELAAELDSHSNVHVGLISAGNTNLEKGNVYISELGDAFNFNAVSLPDSEEQQFSLHSKFAHKTSSEIIKTTADFFGKDLVCVILGSELTDMNEGIQYLIDNEINFIIQNKATSRVYNNLYLLKEAKISTPKRIAAELIANQLYDILNQMRGLRKDTVFYNVPRHEIGKIYVGK